jgi:hypothetical protein
MGVSFFIFSNAVSPNCISSPGEIMLNWRRPVTGSVAQLTHSKSNPIPVAKRMMQALVFM